MQQLPEHTQTPLLSSDNGYKNHWRRAAETADEGGAWTADTMRSGLPQSSQMPRPSARSARGGPSQRRAGAHRPRRTRQARPSRRLARRVNWARRIGVAAAFLLLVGGAVAFAGGALGPGSSGTGTPPSTQPLPAPALLTPTQTITRAARVDLTLTRPTGLSADTEYLVRLFVNDDLIRERPLPRQEQFVLADIPLVEGDNAIRAALASDDEQGELGPALTIVRDTTAPVIRVTRPEPGSTVYSGAETLRGRTEAGATMTVSASGVELETTVDADGRFEAALDLALGPNSLTLYSRDLAGNEASTHITITRTESLASMTLLVSALRLDVSELPERLTATAVIQDERGRPVDGAEVTFSLSPPNATTMTYRTTSAGGRARWLNLEIGSVDSPLGTWLVTVLAVLPSGTELRDDESVIVRQ